MIRLFKSAAAVLWAGLLTLVIVAGVLSAVAHLATPLLGGLRADVEHHLEQALRAPVRIERLAVRWRGLGPELVAKNVAVLDLGGQAGLEIAEVTVALSVADALRHGRLWPSRIGVAGVRVRLVRQPDGALAIEGLRPFAAEPGGGEGDGRARIAALLVPERLRITDAEIVVEDRMRGRPPVVFRNGVLLVRNDGARHQINAALDLPDERGTRLSVAADLQADPGHPEDWRGEVYLDTAGAQIAALVAPFLPPHYVLDKATAQARVWMGWERGEPVWAEGRATVSDLALRGREPARTLHLDRFAGRFRWDRRQDGWLLRATDVALGAAPSGPGAEAAIAWRRSGTLPAAIRLRATALEVTDVAAVLALRPPAGPAFDRLLQAGPGGRLEAVDLAAVQRGADDWWWSAAGTLKEGRVAPAGKIPGLEGLSLRLAATTDGGEARLDTNALRIVAPGIMRTPVLIDRVQGDVAWRRRAGGGWVVETAGVDAANPDLRTRTRFRVELPPEGSPVVDLESDFGDGVLARVPAYLPVGVMEPDAIRWLSESFYGGRLTSGRAVLQGPLADFPFDATRNGRFEVTLGVEDADLEYAPGWPRVVDVDANVRFHGDSMEVKAEHGRIFDTRVLHATARIDSLSRESPVRVQGVTAGPLADVVRVLREGPLGSELGSALEGLAVEGDSRLALDLSIAIDGVGKDRAKGTLTFEDARITHPALPLPLEAIRGNVGFDPAGVKASGLAARLGELPLTIDLAPGRDGATLATLRSGKTDIAALGPLLAARPAWAKGGAAFTAVLSLPPFGRPGTVGLRVESDLVGLALDLPPPLAKGAEARRPLDLEVSFPEKGPVPVRLRYGPDVDAVFLVDRAGGGVARAELRFGGDRAQVPDADQLRLRGRLPVLDVPALADWLRLHPERIPLPLDVALAVERLGLGDDGALTALQLTAQESRTGWQGEARASELEGRFTVPTAVDAGPAVIDLKRLDLRTGETGGPPRPPAAPSRQDPRALPALALTVARVRVNDHDLGNLHATAVRTERGLDLRELMLDGPAGKLMVSGSWHQEPQGPATRVAYRLDTPDFGDVVVALGFADMIERGPGTLSGEHSWPGAPYDFTRGLGTGRLDLNLGAGRFVDVEPGVGRLMGLLNITALQRRLTLDFRDLFQKGLGFDSVTGEFDLRDGSLYTQNLTIRSPSSLIEITGRTGVVARDYDQIVSVTPSLQSALPIAGVAVGGPVGGAAMLVVQGLIGKQFDKIGRVRYSVRGSWDDPKVERLEGQPPTAGQEAPAGQPPAAPGAVATPAGPETPAVEKPGPAPTKPVTQAPAFH